MNGRFRTSISGFHRQDVLDYIKHISEKSAKLNDENKQYLQTIEERDNTILYLEVLLHDCVDEINKLQDNYNRLNDYLESCVSDLSQIHGCMSELHQACDTQLDIICKNDNNEQSSHSDGAH